MPDRDARLPEPPRDVGWTALLTAHMRAVESRRPHRDRLFHDPLALALTGLLPREAELPTGPALPRDLTPVWYMLSTYLAARTVFCDRQVEAAVAEGVRQVVVPAAGFDARAFRLGLPSDTTVFELDSGPVLRFKDVCIDAAGLTPACRRVPVTADLRDRAWQDALAAAGFDPRRPTVWIVEGLFTYLSPDDSDRLLDRLTALSAPGSRLATEYYESNPTRDDVVTLDAAEEAVIDHILRHLRGGPAAPPESWMLSHGWEPDITTLAREIERGGRELPDMFRTDRPHPVNLWLAAGVRDGRARGATADLTPRERVALDIARRLADGPRGLHPINVSAAQLATVARASRETGMSRTLLLAILWQEQQWYQNLDGDGHGLLPAVGRLFDWLLEETVAPGKSLGITHMKLRTAREVIAAHPAAFTLDDGRCLAELDDADLTAYIESRPDEDIRLSAYHLRELQKDPDGSDSDKQLFLLYAADTAQVRAANERHGDDSSPRANAISERAENWDRLLPHLHDALAWEALGDAARRQAVERLRLERGTLTGEDVGVEPIYPPL